MSPQPLRSNEVGSGAHDRTGRIRPRPDSVASMRPMIVAIGRSTVRDRRPLTDRYWQTYA